MKDREDQLNQQLGERMVELTVIKERVGGLQEKYNNVRMDNLRLDQKVCNSQLRVCSV